MVQTTNGARTIACGSLHYSLRDKWIEDLAQYPPLQLNRILYIVPSSTIADDVRHKLLVKAKGWFGLQVVTFDEIVDRALQRSDKLCRRIDRLTQHQMIAHAMRSVDEHQMWAGKPVREWATVTGVVDTLRHHIAEWKRVTSSIESIALDGEKAQGVTSENIIVLQAVLAAYQLKLTENNEKRLLDLEEAYWLAASVMRDVGLQRLYPSVDSVWIDGFTDFAPYQLSVLEPFLNACTVRIHMPHLGDRLKIWPALAKAYQRTMAWFLERGVEQVEGLDDVFHSNGAGQMVETEQRRALPYLRAQLFRSFDEKCPIDFEPSDVHWVGARSAYKQWTWIARRIKQLWSDGVAPSDMAIISKKPLFYGRGAEAVFRSEGVPLAGPSVCRVGEIGLWTEVKDLYSVQEQKWPRDVVARLAGSSLFSDRAPLPGAVTVFAKERGIVDGFDRFIEGEDVHKQQSVASFVRLLKRSVASIPNRASLAEHARAMYAVLETLDIERVRAAAVCRDEEESLVAFRRDMTAHQLLVQSLERLSLAEDHFVGQDLITPLQFVELLDLALSDEPFAVTPRQEGVAWLDPGAIRGISYRYVFFPDMNEGEFPQAERPSWLIDDAYREWAGGHVWLNEPGFAREQSGLQFLQCIAAAKDGIFLSSVLDASDRLSSPFVEEIRSICPRLGDDSGDEFTRGAALAPNDMTWIGNRREWRDYTAIQLRMELSRRQAASESSLARLGLERTRWQAIIQRALVEATRSIEPERYGGRLVHSSIRTQLAEKFSDEAVFSVAQLNRYGQCPFKFMMTNVLRAAPTIEQIDELDAAEQGEVYHEVLRKLYDATPELDAAWFERVPERLDKLLDEAWERWGSAASANRHEGRERAQRDRMRAMLHRWWQYEAQQLAERQGKAKPSYLEWSFGVPLAEGVAAASVEQSISIGSLRMRGRIDRIDTTMDGRFLVYDYKSRSIPQGQNEGYDFQLPLYAAIVQQELLPDSKLAAAMYYSIEGLEQKGSVITGIADDLGFGRRRKLSEEEWEQKVESAMGLAEQYRRSMQTGEFPVAPRVPQSHCASVCEFRHVCRFDPVVHARAQGDEGDE